MGTLVFVFDVWARDVFLSSCLGGPGMGHVFSLFGSGGVCFVLFAQVGGVVFVGTGLHSPTGPPGLVCRATKKKT